MSDERFDGLDELFDYKNQLMNDLLTDDTILHLLSDDAGDDLKAEDLIYKKVFPYEYVPDTVETAGTFICCEVDITETDGKTFLRPTVYLWVFTHRSKVRLKEGGIRVDKLSSRITKLLNGSRMYGLGEMNLSSVRRFSPIANYQGRALTFKTRDFNRLYPTGQAIPANRKR